MHGVTQVAAPETNPKELPRIVIATLAFLTVVDLFAAQAILPSLTKQYGVQPSEMAVAVNASTIGMAISSLLVALFNHRIPRRKGIVCALLLLTIPTLRLAHASGLSEFAALRVIQGLLMACAFSLTLTYLGERTPSRTLATAFAAYIAGNVASNLIGRFLAASVADHWGVPAAFYTLAALNIAGSGLALASLSGMDSGLGKSATETAAKRLGAQLGNRALRQAFAIGFLILFAFIGTFSFINFRLVAPPLNITMSGLGYSYAVFAPSILTTLAAGYAVQQWGIQSSLLIGFGTAALGLPLVLAADLILVLLGMMLIAAGTFFAQGAITGFVSRAANNDKGAASGLYLACYFLGGITGAAVLGRIFEAFGWSGTVAGIALALALASLITLAISESSRIE